METRRTRRIKQRHARRVIAIMMSIGGLGFGLGLALPRSTTAGIVVLVGAVATLVTLRFQGVVRAAITDNERAHAVSSTFVSSAATEALEWLRSRMVPTPHADPSDPGFGESVRLVDSNNGP